MRHLDENVDVTVIGGGLAGLAAAALLAQAGQRVALFERSDALGGRAVTHVEHGFHFNLGPHAWYAGGPGTRVLDGLGIGPRGRTPTPAGAFAVVNGTLHTLPIGFVSLLTTDLLGAHGKLEAARLLARLARMETGSFDTQPLASWLDEHVGDARAREVVGMFIRVAMYANAPRLLSAGASLATFQMVLRHNVRYLDRGWQSIVDALQARALALGVQVIRSAPAVEILHHGAVSGVRLADGTVVVSPNVVLAVPPDAGKRLLPHAPEGVTSGWAGIPSKAACLDVGLARLPARANTVAFGVDRPLYYSVHSATADLAPANGATVHVAKYLPAGERTDASADQAELEGLLDLLQPGWRAEVVVQRYLPAMTVSNAIPLASAGGLEGRPSIEVRDLPGLFLAGDWVGTEATLANASLASAARAARLVIERGRHRGSKPVAAGSGGVNGLHPAEAVHAAAEREFEAHRQFLWGLCYRMTGSAADADDLVQETFVRAIERPPRDLRGGWRAWLARVATNLSIDALRRRKRREYAGPWLPAPIDTIDEASPPGYEIASPEMSTEHRYDLVESVSVAFLLALEHLTPRQRAVLLLRDVFDYTVQETAEALDLTPTNVKVTHHRARRAMKAYDASRLPPTRDRQARTAARLQEFLECLRNQDVAGVEALLAADVRALNDGGGEYHGARQPVVGRRNVARLLLGLSAKGGASASGVSLRMLNGFPAVVADLPVRAGFAPRFTFQIELDAGERIAAVHVVLASRKLVALSSS